MAYSLSREAFQQELHGQRTDLFTLRCAGGLQVAVSNPFDAAMLNAVRYDAHGPVQFALAWLWANRIVSSVIAGPRTLAQWQDYVAAIGTPWSAEDEALVDSLVRPGHPSTPGYSDPAYPIHGRKTKPITATPRAP